MKGKDKAPYAVKGFCPVEPVPKGRPRFNSKTRITYTPQETIDYENAVRNHFIKRYGLTTPPMDGPLLARYEFILPRPKSVPKKSVYKEKKPDIDNLVKSFQDALDFKVKAPDGHACGVIANDSRIAILATSKRYARDGERPGTRYCIQTLGSMVAVLGDGVASGLADILLPSVPALLLSQVRELAVEVAGGAYGSAEAVGAAGSDDPVRSVYLILSCEDDGDEALDIVKTAFPNCRLICSN